MKKNEKINGESGDVRGKTVNSWKERTPELLQEYLSENIWNHDETGSFWRALLFWQERITVQKVAKKSKTVGDNCLNCRC